MKHIHTDTFEHISLQVGWATRVGEDHKENGQPNEDAVRVLQGADLGILNQQLAGLTLLADGAGGEPSALCTSTFVVDFVADRVKQKVESYADSVTSLEDDILSKILSDAARSAHETILEKALNGKSTFVGALWSGQRAFIAHVGDSRVYLIHNHSVRQVTKDHSSAQRYIELGLKSPERAMKHPMSHNLLHAMGHSEFKIDRFSEIIKDGEWLLLCSDGLWNVLSDADMLSIVTTAQTPQAACDQLVHAAQKTGSDDDISVIVAGLRAL